MYNLRKILTLLFFISLTKEISDVVNSREYFFTSWPTLTCNQHFFKIQKLIDLYITDTSRCPIRPKPMNNNICLLHRLHKLLLPLSNGLNFYSFFNIYSMRILIPTAVRFAFNCGFEIKRKL